MIYDRLENWQTYQGLNARWLRALEFLRSSNLEALPLGRHDLDGDRLFALVQEYSTKPENQCRWEAHQRYCDVQYLVRGVERMGVAPIGSMQVEQPYDADRDVAFFTGEGDYLTLRSGSFVIFAPQDVHRPCIECPSPETVRKVVIKAEIAR